MHHLLPAAAASLIVATPVAAAQPPTLLEGQSAVTRGDSNAAGNVIHGSSPDVFIGNKPAALMGDLTNCGGADDGAATVFINNKPVALSVPNCMNKGPDKGVK